jgi:hypothetical protein
MVSDGETEIATETGATRAGGDRLGRSGPRTKAQDGSERDGDTAHGPLRLSVSEEKRA